MQTIYKEYLLNLINNLTNNTLDSELSNVVNAFSNFLMNLIDGKDFFNDIEKRLDRYLILKKSLLILNIAIQKLSEKTLSLLWLEIKANELGLDWKLLSTDSHSFNNKTKNSLNFKVLLENIFYQMRIQLINQLSENGEAKTGKAYLKEVEHLVIQGGGAKGFAYSQIMIALYQDCPNLRTVGGSSVGALTGLLIALGFRNIEGTLKRILIILSEKTTAFVNKSEVSHFLVPLLDNLIKEQLRLIFSACFKPLPDELSPIYAKVKLDNPINEPITFEDLGLLSASLAEKKSKIKILDLYVTRTNLTDSCLEISDQAKTPKQSVAYAVAVSCAHPFLFQFIIDEGKKYTDGGLWNNLPIGYALKKGGHVLALSLSNDAHFIPDHCQVGDHQMECLFAELSGSDSKRMKDYQSQEWKEIVRHLTEGDLYILNVPFGQIGATQLTLNDKSIQVLSENGFKAYKNFSENIHVFKERRLKFLLEDLSKEPRIDNLPPCYRVLTRPYFKELITDYLLSTFTFNDRAEWGLLGSILATHRSQPFSLFGDTRSLTFFKKQASQYVGRRLTEALIEIDGLNSRSL